MGATSDLMVERGAQPLRLVDIKVDLFDAGNQVGMAVELDKGGERLRAGQVFALEQVEALARRMLACVKQARAVRAQPWPRVLP